MKYTFILIAMVLSVNSAGLMLDYAGIDYTMTDYNATQSREAYNKTGVIEGSDLSEQEFYHVGRWVSVFWDTIKTIIFGFHDDMIYAGVPSSLALIIDALWLFIVFNFLFSLLMGRDYMP